MTLRCQYAKELAIFLNSTYMHWNQNTSKIKKKKNDRSLKKFSNACKYVLKRYMSYSFVLCQFHYTINGGLAEWMKAHHLQCMQYLEFFFCTLVIIIIVICEQGGRTHNGTFVGSGHGRWSHHWVMSFDPHPLSSVKASITIIA